jgi:alpha-ketoglutarate-dependent taurine dioxygenase
MNITNIYDSWGSYVDLTIDELLSHDKSFWQSLILKRNLIVFKGLPTNLSDVDLYDLSLKFGKVWSKDIYALPFISNGTDKTINSISDKPVSHFKSGNNYFSSKEMKYHADMVHVNEYSYPGRALYMFKNSVDLSGITTWLNLELGWEQCTKEEKTLFDEYEIVMQDMYVAETRLEKFPFLKINPKTGKISPLVNCCYHGPLEKNRAWIHHAEKNGVALSYKDTLTFVESVYSLLESKLNTLYEHTWTVGDLIVYDNWFNVHKRTSVNESDVSERILKRTTFNFD